MIPCIWRLCKGKVSWTAEHMPLAGSDHSVFVSGLGRTFGKPNTHLKRPMAFGGLAGARRCAYTSPVTALRRYSGSGASLWKPQTWCLQQERQECRPKKRRSFPPSEWYWVERCFSRSQGLDAQVLRHKLPSAEPTSVLSLTAKTGSSAELSILVAARALKPERLGTLRYSPIARLSTSLKMRCLDSEP